jgi:hydroxymethylpyrimidine pyrophosphatase-like HAD family hydrolase
MEEGRAHFAGRAEVTLSHPRFLEFLAPGVSKGLGVRWLARHFGIPLAQCVAIGDQYNDLEMISEVGYGVAMPSAPAAVQAAARFVAPPVGEQGAAQMIERIALEGWSGVGTAGSAAPGGEGGEPRGVKVERR